MILKHQNKRFFERTHSATTTANIAASRKTANSGRKGSAARS